MDCKHYQARFSDLLGGKLEEQERQDLEKHLASCSDCKEELTSVRGVWERMAELIMPPPSTDMTRKFSQILEEYKDSVYSKKTKKNRIYDALSGLWLRQPRLPLVYTLMIVLVCIVAGLWFSGHKNDDTQLKTLDTEVQDLRKTMMLALLENPSASERIRAVNFTPEIKHTDQRVINALLLTLNNDQNVNVRLTTLDALERLASHPEVRQGLIEAIVQQDSPLMQSAIADVMVKLQEKKSVESFRKLLKKKDLDHGVRDKIQETIKSLI